jgi:hypothetical protein
MRQAVTWVAAASSAGSSSGGNAVFYLLVTLHVLAAVTGFSSTGFAGTYASRTGRLLAGPEAAEVDDVEELQRYFARPARLWWALLAVPVFGGAALSLQPDGQGIGQLWALAALGAWLAAVALAARLVVPSLAVLRALLARAYPVAGEAESAPSAPLPPDDAARARRAGQLASRSAAVCDCLFFVALALMIWQPN